MSLKTVSLFSGIGGLDYGFEAAGFETRVALDLDPVACATLRLNRNWPVIEGLIADIPSSTILDSAGLSVGEADILIGGPPCQPFSKSGYWARGDAPRLNDPRADTLAQFLRVLGDVMPKAYLIENVPGLAYRGKAEGIDAIRAGISEINKKAGTKYSFEFKVLNAADFGVPQMRERVFIVGSRDGTRFEFPRPTHGEPGTGLEPFRTAWDAFADLPRPADLKSLKAQGKWADLLPSIPEGQNYLWHTQRGGGEPLFGWRRRYWNFLLKLAKNRPAWTIQAQPGPATGPFHWENRRFSTYELCRLQTFPDFFEVCLYACRHSAAGRECCSFRACRKIGNGDCSAVLWTE
ncbi:DNA cytosine methyltransferase [Neorhizobium galegae]|nr:DNA cytosine methyltransferase [Neorhizobium galegae]